jgi:hypothetical protein
VQQSKKQVKFKNVASRLTQNTSPPHPKRYPGRRMA